jgi:HSP20 family protein
MSTERNMNRSEQAAAEKLEQRPTLAPFVDIHENADQILVLADLPGVIQDGLKIHLEKGELSFEARRADGGEVGPAQNSSGLPDYRRSFLLPQGIDHEKISADLKNGVLHIHLPQAAALKPRQSPIRAG